MALSDSMFLVEIIVEELRSYVNCREFIVKSQFADVFSITLQDPKGRDKVLTKSLQNKYLKRKPRVWRHPRIPLTKPPPKPKVQSGQSIILTNDLENLISNMRQYPIELSLWSKLYPQYKLASTCIPWTTASIDYLSMAHTVDSEPVSAQGEYNVFDEFTSRRMAVVKLNIKLSYLAENITTQIKSLYKNTSENVMSSDFDSKLSSAINTTKKEANNESTPAVVLNTANKGPNDASEETGIIKTIYKGGIKKNKKPDDKKTNHLGNDIHVEESDGIPISEINNAIINNIDETNKSNTVNSSIISLVKSESDMDKKKQIDVIKSKSCSSINQDQLNILNYIFGNSNGPFGNQVYCVSYFTVENDNIGSPKSPKSVNSPKGSPTSIKTKSTNPETVKSSVNSSEKSKDREQFKFKLCDKECLEKNIETGSCDLSICSIEIPISKNAADFTTVTKCEQITCENKQFRKLPTPPDERILLDLTNLKQECCDNKTDNKGRVEKLEKVAGGMKAKMKIGDDPCYCECECKFGFTKKTVYCKVCGGYETVGEELAEKFQFDMPFPCPIYHKLVDKSKLKSMPTTLSGGEVKKTPKKSDKKSIESDKESKKGKKKKKENKFKFNYGYTAAKIGHSRCALPCSGTISPVPRRMGWLWNSEEIPGMKFRPAWKPGAVSKHVLKLLRIAKNPEEAFVKKKRKKDTGKPKRPLKRPLIVVQKVDGEYIVTMETMKAYAKPRTVSQVPYEEKPLSTYKIGRTDEENLQRRKKKERARRRLERDQRRFIQSAFRDMCQDICIKTYQQALGILPDAEVPDCTCYPAEPNADRTDMDLSCSCSEDSNLEESDTDSDEWLLEFTPPVAHFDPTYKAKKVVHVDNSSQYSYLDYRVKLLDRYGNPVPRFFKGPDGKEQCSDLGGFWNSENKWLEINVDGYVAPDGRWAPNIFIGPNNEHVDAELGKFQAMDGTWLVVGIDGYVDAQGRWQSYTKPKPQPKVKKRRSIGVTAKKQVVAKKKAAVKKVEENVDKKSEATWSCFGDASAKYLSEMGIMGHGHDRKLLLDTLNKLIAQGEDVKIPQMPAVPRSHNKKVRRKLYHTVSTKPCRHAKPSSKGVVAVDGYGNKIYFKLRDYKNKRPAERIAALTDQGISVSSFHMPCFHSFINSELMKKQQYDRLVALSKARGEPKPQEERHYAERYQHNRRYQDSYPPGSPAGTDKNEYKNIIV